jgi:hypothetical protein
LKTMIEPGHYRKATQRTTLSSLTHQLHAIH